MPRPTAAALLALTLTLSACSGSGVAADAVTTVAPTTTPSTTTAPTTTTKPTTTTTPPALPPAEPPNIILILMDDLSTHMMEVGFYRSLPSDSTLEALMAAGTTFPNYFNTTPLCCPSRTSILTGQFSHNHLVYGNRPSITDGFGGFEGFQNEHHEDRSLAVALSDAGYRTVFIGKYLNGYQQTAPTHVPPGWDRWRARLGAVLGKGNRYLFPRFNVDGTIVPFGAEEPGYVTDVESDFAVTAIEDLFPEDAPAFILLATSAPHPPAVPAPRHTGAHREAGIQPHRPPSCQEEDISDKPRYVRMFQRHFEANDGLGYSRCWGEEYEAHLDQTLALDELLDSVMDAVRRSPDADNTYVVLASDNGRMRGEHWITTKGVPYEESIRTPMIVVGPGVSAGATDMSIVLNIDLGPTFLDLAGAGWVDDAEVDGESIRSLLTGDETDWRASALLEVIAATPRTPAWRAVRTADHVYIEYETGDIELYDLTADPWQLDSIAESAPAETLTAFESLLAAWTDCAGSACWDAGRLAPPR